MTKKIRIEGWRFVHHSYACINMWQTLELLKREEYKIFNFDMPYFNKSWEPVMELINSESDNLLRSVAAPAVNEKTDVTYRIDYPFNFTTAKSDRLFIFGTSENHEVLPEKVAGKIELKKAHAESEAIIVTCSQWSAQGFINSGADPERVKVVPLGVDTGIFHPVTEIEKNKLRQDLGWCEDFVFLHIGAMTNNKGIRYLLKAFAKITEHFPNVRLCLKGSENLYNSSILLNQSTFLLTETEKERVLSKIIYYGNPLSFTAIAKLYQAADTYISPYTAEGFNLPVLEAIAAGLPVICTKGGPTDEFTVPLVARRIKSRLIKEGNARGLLPDLNNLIYHMSTVIEDKKFQKSAKQYGPSFVENSYTWRHNVDKLLKVMFPE